MQMVDRRFFDVRITVDGALTMPPAEVKEGAQYLVIGPATGAFEGHENNIAYFVNGAWKFYKDFKGQSEVYDIDADLLYRYEQVQKEVEGEMQTVGEWTSYDIVRKHAEEVVDERIVRPVKSVALYKNELSGTNTPSVDAGTRVVNGQLLIDVNGKGGAGLYTASVAGTTVTWSPVTVAVDERFGLAADGKIYTVVNTSDQENLTFEATTLQENAIFLSVSDDNIYTYDADNTQLINLTRIEERPEYRRRTYIYKHVLTADEISTNKHFELPKLAMVNEGILCSLNGVIQVPGDDYTASNAGGKTTFSWGGKGLEAADLHVGDIIVLSYNTEEIY